MTPKLDSALFIDPQAQPPTGICENCGRELYENGQCPYCERSEP